MKYQCGDVYYINPSTDKPYEFASRSTLRFGRPGIIVSSQQAMGRYQLMVVLCTTKARYNDPCAFSTVIRGRTATVLCSEIQTVDISQLGTYITHLEDPDMFKLMKALKNSIGFISESSDAEQKLLEIKKLLGEPSKPVQKPYYTVSRNSEIETEREDEDEDENEDY